jgi:hypothetical protein
VNVELWSEFRDKTGLLFDRIINWWKEHTISSAISTYDAKRLHLSGPYSFFISWEGALLTWYSIPCYRAITSPDGKPARSIDILA